MSAADLSEQLARTEQEWDVYRQRADWLAERIIELEDVAKRATTRSAVANMHADAAQDVADGLAERLNTLLAALAEAGIVVRGGRSGPDGDEEHWWAEGRIVGTSSAAEVLGEQIVAARRDVAAYRDDDPPMCPCGEPATVELTGDSGWLCEGCAA